MGSKNAWAASGSPSPQVIWPRMFDAIQARSGLRPRSAASKARLSASKPSASSPPTILCQPYASAAPAQSASSPSCSAIAIARPAASLPGPISRR